ncbi:integrase catalytic domain-containing protein [Trichonephila clavipes]|nr:integrase catalytic domain-containing protein [Trichonephila clavipes]
MFKNCRKEDLRVVALELGETVAEKVTIVELTEIIKENKYFKEDGEFVKELIQYTIEDHNEITGEGCNSLDALVKSVRILMVKVPNRPEGWALFFACSLEKEVVSHISVRAGNDWFYPLELAKEIDLYNTSWGKSLQPLLNVFTRNNPVKNASRVFLTITEDLVPTTKIDFNLNNIPNLKLADKNFNIPERVQMLLGAEVFYELMLPGQFKTEGSNVIFQNTVFGFIVSGSISSDAQGKEHCGFIQAADNLEHSIKKFWEIENVEINSVKTSELDICEDHFKNTHSRDDQGRYTVAMPLKVPSCLGESRQTAIQRLNSLWKRLRRDKEYLSLYEKFLQEYEDLSYMREIKADGSGVSFYMPHHGVYRPEKSTTKLRTVFNA